MSNYTVTTNFADKDTLPSGSADRVIKGSEFGTEFNNIATAIATKVDSTNADFVKLTNITATATEINYLDGVTSNVQQQIDDASLWTASGSTAQLYGDIATIENGGFFFTDERTANNIPHGATIAQASGLVVGHFLNFALGGSFIGSITRNGTTGVSYNTSSDYRLKENVTPVTNASERVMSLRPCRFNFIGEDRTVDGFLAHEAQAVVPESVTGDKDQTDSNGNPVYQGIDQSKLVPLLTAALQEALERIEALEGGAE